MTKFKDGDDLTGPSGWKPGYLLGGGIEQGFGGGLSATIEYNYVTTKDVSTTTLYGKTKTNVNDHVIKAGVTTASDATIGTPITRKALKQVLLF
ncbi:hypothetical protein CES85_3889 [Ochrobactrum quorumnocens]|uniref:Uncharacterized protein n=1 Tax=Ochrobactrum quorumnocens TaxID=271865 RepID=A0A248U8U1_9HYPH|nr:hypothetical protein [[Ochrobactrum] quorumnocens]ASV83114.1 hypothetical protein CES85_3889 [[Ochrobactrum] quorumnocens]